MTMNDMDFLCLQRVTINELSRLLGVSRPTLYRWMQEGQLPTGLIHYGLGGRPYFIRAEISIFLQELDKMRQEHPPLRNQDKRRSRDTRRD